MTSPVPYESRVRPLIAAAGPVPWMFDGAVLTDAGCRVVSDDIWQDARDARLTVTAVNTAAASADLAEAVRGAVNEAGQEIVFEGARCVVVSPEAIDALRAALSRLDAAAGAP